MLDTYHFHFHGADTKKVLDRLETLERTIMASQAEHAAQLVAVKEQLDKAKAEIVANVAALEAAIAAAGATTPEVDAALAALKGSAQGLDDLNPDAPVDPTAP